MSGRSGMHKVISRKRYPRRTSVGCLAVLFYLSLITDGPSEIDGGFVYRVGI